MSGAHNAPSPFVFSVAVHMLRGREMERGKPESMLETCAFVPDPPCRRCTDSTGSVRGREVARAHKDDLFITLSNKSFTGRNSSSCISVQSDWFYLPLKYFPPMISTPLPYDCYYHIILCCAVLCCVKRSW